MVQWSECLCVLVCKSNRPVDAGMTSVYNVTGVLGMSGLSETEVSSCQLLCRDPTIFLQASHLPDMRAHARPPKTVSHFPVYISSAAKSRAPVQPVASPTLPLLNTDKVQSRVLPGQRLTEPYPPLFFRRLLFRRFPNQSSSLSP